MFYICVFAYFALYKSQSVYCLPYSMVQFTEQRLLPRQHPAAGFGW